MYLIEKMCESGVDAISMDSPEAGIGLPAAAARVSQNVVIIGNISPTGSILNGTTKDVEDDVTNLLKSMEPYPNFILSTGCDLPQEVPLENISAFVNVGRDYELK